MKNKKTFEEYIRLFYYDDIDTILFGQDGINFICHYDYHRIIDFNKRKLDDPLVFIFTRTPKNKKEESFPRLSYPLHYNQFKTEFEYWLRNKKFERLC